MKRTHVWGAAVAICLIAATAGLSAQGIGIPIVRSMQMIADTLISIVRPVAVIAMIVCGLLWMFGESHVRSLGNIVFGAFIALFAITIVSYLF